MTKSTRHMTSRERVIAAIQGKPIDRVPVMYWLNPHATAKMISEVQPGKNRLANFFGKWCWKKFIRGGELDAKEIWRALPLLLSGYAINDYTLELGADLAQVTFGTLKNWGKLYRENKRIRVKDAFGNIRGICGIYLEVIDYTFKDIKDLEKFEFPDFSADENMDSIRKYRKDHPDACLYADNFGVQDILATQMFEMSRMMMAMCEYPDEIKKFQARMADYMIDLGRRSIKAGADIVFIYDDYGYTGKTLISEEMWLEFTYPHLKKMIEAYHEEGALVMLHSCGYQMPLLKHYVAAELDCLQTFQPKADNDFEKAYEEFGDRLAFNTGIDIQLGEQMTPGELKEDILKSYRIGGMKGRHILGTTHMLQYTMPLKNIKAIIETVRDIQAGVYN